MGLGLALTVSLAPCHRRPRNIKSGTPIPSKANRK